MKLFFDLCGDSVITSEFDLVACETNQVSFTNIKFRGKLSRSGSHGKAVEQLNWKQTLFVFHTKIKVFHILITNEYIFG